VRFNAKNYDNNAFKRLQIIRFLDDWAYQANIRGQITTPCDIKNIMLPYLNKLIKIFKYEIDPTTVNYTYPWNRTFEIEVHI